MILKNKTFISTRPANQNKELANLLEANGAILLEMPTIEIKPVTLSLDEEDMLEHINQFSWIVFTSPNGIRYFFKKLYEITGSYELPSSMKTAVVGIKTNQVLNEFGHDATFE
nr:uroporphyrinogen-III synthase [Prolixibacteraceae bacterium]